MVTAPELSLRGAKRRGNLAVHSRITGYSRRNRNCLPAIATGAKRPRNDNSDSLAPLNHCCNTCSCQRRSGNAATVKPGSMYGRRCLSHSGSAFPRLHPKGTSSRFALRAPRARSALAMTNPGPSSFYQQPVRIGSIAPLSIFKFPFAAFPALISKGSHHV